MSPENGVFLKNVSAGVIVISANIVISPGASMQITPEDDLFDELRANYHKVTQYVSRGKLVVRGAITTEEDVRGSFQFCVTDFYVTENTSTLNLGIVPVERSVQAHLNRAMCDDCYTVHGALLEWDNDSDLPLSPSAYGSGVASIWVRVRYAVDVAG